MKEFIFEEKKLARLIEPDDWKEGPAFFSNDEEFIQVGTFFYDKGKQIQDHVHKEFARTAYRTYETMYMVSGRMRVDLFTSDKRFVEAFEAKQGDTVILLEGGHGFEILEDGTKILEVKNGPFMGVEVDKEKF